MTTPSAPTTVTLARRSSPAAVASSKLAPRRSDASDLTDASPLLLARAMGLADAPKGLLVPRAAGASCCDEGLRSVGPEAEGDDVMTAVLSGSASAATTAHHPSSSSSSLWGSLSSCVDYVMRRPSCPSTASPPRASRGHGRGDAEQSRSRDRARSRSSRSHAPHHPHHAHHAHHAHQHPLTRVSSRRGGDRAGYASSADWHLGGGGGVDSGAASLTETISAWVVGCAICILVTAVGIWLST